MGSVEHANGDWRRSEPARRVLNRHLDSVVVNSGATAAQGRPLEHKGRKRTDADSSMWRRSQAVSCANLRGIWQEDLMVDRSYLAHLSQPFECLILDEVQP